MGLKSSKEGEGERPGKEEGHHKHNFFDIQIEVIKALSKNIFLRSLVSKQRRRMLVGGYDLDMSYINERILAMSFPAERMRAMYRNPMWQVKSVLDTRHESHYKVYNLCIEQDYNPSHFHGRVERFPFDDNHVPPLHMIKDFCEDVDSWLSSDPENVAVVHCMAGKGRTGLMVSSYLVYKGMSAEAALQVYAQKRTKNNEAVSLPSQRRYVGYWEKLLTFSNHLPRTPPLVNLPKPLSRELRRIRLYDAVNTGTVFFVVTELQEVPGQRYYPPVEVAKSCCRQIEHGFERPTSPRYYYSFVEKGAEREDLASEELRLVVQMDTESPVLYQKTSLEYYFERPVKVNGDVRLIFYEKRIGSRLFYTCFNTDFIRNSLLQFGVKDLDKVGKKGRSICGPAFCLELLFGPANADCLPSIPNNDDFFDDFSDSSDKS